MNNPGLIALTDVVKEYVSDEVVTPALKGVSFEIYKGEFVAIMGPSGSGKSTLMHIMGFLDTLTRGQYFFDGNDVSTLDSDLLAAMRRDHVGFIFQSFNLLPKSSVLENVMLPLLYTKESRSERRARVLESIEAVNMTHRKNNLSNQLSGGERQRVAIARALVNQPSIIFADEPTGNLDTKTGEQILQLLCKLNGQGRTIVMVTHEEEAAEFARRIIRCRDGRLESDRSDHRRRVNGFSK
jgi:putative ABC transport system ATP-binding protein